MSHCWISCPWCHHMNRAPLDHGPLRCERCGHRVDKPRLACDCPTCKAPRTWVEIDPDDLDSLVAWLKQRRAQGNG
jgi:hypothetical protein